jgi:hypothetical protein
MRSSLDAMREKADTIRLWSVRSDESSSIPKDRPAAAADRLARLAEKLAVLEGVIVGGRLQLLREKDIAMGRQFTHSAAERSAKLYRQRVLDWTLDAPSRIGALRMLAIINHPGMRDGTICRAMMDLYRFESSLDIKRDVLTYLVGIQDEDARSFFMYVATGFEDRHIREQAISNLMYFVDNNTDVARVLDFLSSSDASQEVRRAARVARSGASSPLFRRWN